LTIGKDAVVRGYAEALFAIAEAEGELEGVEDELYSFAKTLERETKLREALIDQTLPAENRKSLIRDVLGERANPHTVSILGFIVEQGRAKDLGRIIEGLAEVAAEQRQHVVAEVRSAVPLDDKRRARLAKALSKATGRSVEVKVVVDPTLVGGVVSKVGNEVFDGSVRTRLAEAKHHLSGA
jgi:F-type H+-transporting ATPase subunit delta